MKRALIAATVYFLALFALGFVLGTVRVLIVAPRIGVLRATVVEVPSMLTAAYFCCRRVIARWQVPTPWTARLVMALWFLALLTLSETVLGTALFGQTLARQWTALTAPAGLLGLTAQAIAASMPIFIGEGRRQ